MSTSRSETPTDLSPEQRQLLEKFEALAEQRRTKEESFGEKVKGFWDDLTN